MVENIFVFLRSNDILGFFLPLLYQQIVDMNCKTVYDNGQEMELTLIAYLDHTTVTRKTNITQILLSSFFVLFLTWSYFSSFYVQCLFSLSPSFHQSFVLLLPFFYAKTRAFVHLSSFPLLTFFSFLPSSHIFFPNRQASCKGSSRLQTLF